MSSRFARPLFVLTILGGSFLLFLVQPMVARMALPRLGGAPAVWNSAMLVYQALLLGGYAYAHWLGRFGADVDQLPMFWLRSPQSSNPRKISSPTRQSMRRCLQRKEAQTMRTRFCMKPV